MAGKNSRVVVRIREMILHGDLLPGQRVREMDLASALGVSRTPVRESLPILAQEGILKQLDTRGFVVREFTPQEIMDAIDVRGVLEGLAARTLAEQGPPRRLIQSLYDCLRDGDQIFAKGHLVESDEDRYGDMNKQFHSVIVHGAGSKVIADAIERNGRIPFAAAQAIAFDRVDLRRMYDALWYAHRQHHAIVQALDAGEGQRVASLMFEHAYGTKASINMARTNWRSSTEEAPSVSSTPEPGNVPQG
ncbi:MAG TPA: GntR family transcriptional regulator [Candidatus Acidoferrales bacterium]|jgi:GntR family transcriptional regulator of vanillate catabolism|nr:GntR family transcriptional regulator [Candidatus Acidoferrales bacterium]